MDDTDDTTASCSTLPMRTRPFSAYSNLCSVDENDEIVETQLIDWQCHSDESYCELDVAIQREPTHPGGLAFRIIGSRTSGIFVSYVDRKSQQASLLQEGDLIKKCNGKVMSGITCEQAASILRFTLSHKNELHLHILRKGSGPVLMAKRRSLAQLSQEQEQLCRLSAVRTDFCQPSPSRLRQSTSCPDYRRSSNAIPVKVTVLNSRLLRKVQSVDDEIELLVENEEHPSPEHTTVTSGGDGRNHCSICSRKVRAKRLHMMSHRWLAASLKLLPIRRSRSAFHPNSYTLI